MFCYTFEVALQKTFQSDSISILNVQTKTEKLFSKLLKCIDDSSPDRWKQSLLSKIDMLMLNYTKKENKKKFYFFNLKFLISHLTCHSFSINIKHLIYTQNPFY